MTLQRLFSIVGAVAMVGCTRTNVLPAVAPETRASATASAGGSDVGAQVSMDAELVSDFKRRVGRYMQLHDKVQRQGTRPRERDDVGENLVSQQAMAMRIRFARHDARPGDLFTPTIAVALRRALDPVLRGASALRARESIREDAPKTFVLVVNGSFPQGDSRSTMPGNVLQILPSLPNGLEYRIVDTHLVLIDLDADIVVDYMLDVMCQKC